MPRVCEYCSSSACASAAIAWYWVPYAEKTAACWADTGSAAAGAMTVVADAAPAFCAARLLLIPDSNVSAANISSVWVVRNDICCSYVERVDHPWVELCVHVTAAV